MVLWNKGVERLCSVPFLLRRDEKWIGEGMKVSVLKKILIIDDDIYIGNTYERGVWCFARLFGDRGDTCSFSDKTRSCVAGFDAAGVEWGGSAS